MKDKTLTANQNPALQTSDAGEDANEEMLVRAGLRRHGLCCL